MPRRFTTLFLLVTVTLTLMEAMGVVRAQTQSPAPEMELRGRLVHLDDSKTNLVLKTGDGKQYPLQRTKLSEALFADPRLMQKELILKGRLATNHAFDVTIIRSVVNGVVNDLYYWCDVCAIQQVMPGECMCCREPVRLVEKPVGEKNSKDKTSKEIPKTKSQ